jgi:hypothetical protein
MMKIVLLTVALIGLSLSPVIGFAKDGGRPSSNNSTGVSSTHPPTTTTAVAAKSKNNGNTNSGQSYLKYTFGTVFTTKGAVAQKGTVGNQTQHSNSRH